MTLPTDFQFSQGSLQDYVDCPRRFQLHHLQRVAWPAIEAEPALENERFMQQGAAFHRLVHQQLLGLPVEQLSRLVTDPDLSRWWRNYLENRPADLLPPTYYPESLLSAPIGDYRLVARYDLVAVDTGRRAAIVDWKTSRRRSPRRWLAERLQTQVYPYLLVQAGAHLNGGQPLEPEQVEMIYWFADFPDQPERFAYDAAQYKADEAYLESLVEQIASRAAEDDGFPLTTERRHCRHCRYRSLCRRGVEADRLDDEPGERGLDAEPDAYFDFEQIAEIEY